MDPRQNIMAGALYLRRLLDSHRGNVKLALASYNAGPGEVAKYGAIPPFKETRNYVKKVTGAAGRREARATTSHERHHLVGEALHLLELRAELQQQEIHAGAPRTRSTRSATCSGVPTRPARSPRFDTE